MKALRVSVALITVWVMGALVGFGTHYAWHQEYQKPHGFVGKRGAYTIIVRHDAREEIARLESYSGGLDGGGWAILSINDREEAAGLVQEMWEDLNFRLTILGAQAEQKSKKENTK